ncbi:hypothetical protein ABE41_004340 [Fictibacillus arsenicus]|uniref:Uncharacterized protein n=1 Tax=Fictibacillus arsenicus TaxID=255247 RepID=A0A1B1Z1H6_9BACL|nr:hypothetical protein ABE41_004340 [Fictibacillus arsenicus]
MRFYLGFITISAIKKARPKSLQAIFGLKKYQLIHQPAKKNGCIITRILGIGFIKKNNVKNADCRVNHLTEPAFFVVWIAMLGFMIDLEGFMSAIRIL